MERHFEHQMEKLQKRVIKMSTLVSEQLQKALKAVETKDIELAKEVLEIEKDVDKLDIKIDKLCLKLVVLNQPVAMDMRFIFAAININTDLERIGDLSSNIARGMLDHDFTDEELAMINFEKIANVTSKMLNKSIDSFIQKSAFLTKEVLMLESALNQLRDRELDVIKNYLKSNPERIDEALYLYDMVHALERIGDHSTNIAEEVYFIIEAQNIRHKYEDILFDTEEE